jgi:hypothetical protein
MLLYSLYAIVQAIFEIIFAIYSNTTRINFSNHHISVLGLIPALQKTPGVEPDPGTSKFAAYPGHKPASRFLQRRR